MNRLTTMGPDGRPQMTAGTSIIDLTERLYQFEETLDGAAMEQLRSLRGHCRDWAGSELADEIWRRDVEALGRVLALAENKEDYTDGIN